MRVKKDDPGTECQLSPESIQKHHVGTPDFPLLVSATVEHGVIYIGDDDEILASGLIRPGRIPRQVPGDVTIDYVRDGLVQCTRLENRLLLLSLPAAESCKRDEGFITFLAQIVAVFAFWKAVVAQDDLRKPGLE